MPTPENPKVSVCIPTYNRRDYLRLTLDSVFDQTFTDYEVVVVDDGSTDGTRQMLDDAGYDLRYERQPNAGDAAARNHLIRIARGRYISFIDSDDLLLPDSLERMVAAAESQPGPAIVYGPYFRIDQHGNVYGRCSRRLHSGRVTPYLFQDILVHSCGSMFPTKILAEAGGFDESLPVCSDYDLWLRLSLKYPFVAVPEPTFKRRRHLSNLSSASAANEITQLRVLERFYSERGGKDLVPPEIAARRFSRIEYRIAKYSLAEGRPDDAARYFAASFKRRPNLKAALGWLRSRLG